MTCMAGTVIHDHNFAHIERIAQLVLNFLPDRHFFIEPPSILIPKD